MMPSEERAALERRFRRAFNNLPKSRYWRTAAYDHLGEGGLTIEIVAETLEYPTDIAFQRRRKGSRQAFYKYYPINSEVISHLDDAQGGAWFRVVLDDTGSLYTAFRDNFTEMEGGRPSCLTPSTTTNF